MTTDALAITVRAARRADLDALSHFHYRARPPATLVRVLAASCDGIEHAGVLAVSMPVLNAPWRRDAWPDLARATDPRDHAHIVNTSVRTISRVIVDPRLRGRGIAEALVRAYLDDPITPLTESIAAMGRFCPFFTRAGMRAIAVRPALHDERLRLELRVLRIHPVRLADETFVQAHLRADPRLAPALARWSQASRATRAITCPAHLAPLAASRLACPRIAFVAP